MKQLIIVKSVLVILISPLLCAATLKLNLSGQWQFALDPKDIGEKNAWYFNEFEHHASLPGSVVENGYGDEITVNTQFRGHIYHKWYDSAKYEPYRQPDNIKIPSFLTPSKHYVGPAWFSKEIAIPNNWANKQIFLSLERCNFETTVWLDGRKIESQNSLSTPHIFHLGQVKPGKHKLSIRVDNRLSVDVGVSHAVNDWIQTHWNGIIGQINLIARDPVYIDDVQIYPNVKTNSVKVEITAINTLQSNRKCLFELKAAGFNGAESHQVKKISFKKNIRSRHNVFDIEYKMGTSVHLWNEHTPNLYRLTINLKTHDITDEYTAVFGMREVDIKDKRFTINGKKTMLRGTNESGIFPLTGYASMKAEDWRDIFKRYKSFGLNHMRFHSWCPPKAAFQAADEIGFYLQPEGPFNCRIGDGKPVDNYLKEELTRILNTYGNHPSFVLMAHGNEPGGDGKEKLLASEVSRWKKLDSRHKYTAGSGWPLIEENDYHCNHTPRLQLWGEGLMSRINSEYPGTEASFIDLYSTYDRPMVIHESGQWCVYPNFEEISKYTGILKARNFEIFKDFLTNNNLGGMGQRFLMASGKLQTICYKAEIEHALRTPDCAGFQLLALHDYPGQGSALVGVIDAFRDPKPYINADEFRRFCNTTVPLAKFEKYTWTQNETFTADVVAAHFGLKPLNNMNVIYTFSNSQGTIVKQEKWESIHVPIGDNQQLGKIRFPCRDLEAPSKYTLTVSIENTDYHNSWDIWIYPENVNTHIPKDLLLVDSLNDQAIQYLNKGGKVLLIPDIKTIETPCKIGFGSMFWNVSFTNYQAPHTLGLLCDPSHSTFHSFPTEYHSNWQWWDLIRSSSAIIIDTLPADLKPLIQPIDNYFDARRLSLLYEAQVAGGKLMVCTIDLTNNLKHRPVARQLRHSIINYMTSNHFKPSVSLSPEQVNGTLSVAESNSILKDIGAKIFRVSAEIPEAKAENIIDGKKKTIWLSNKQYGKPNPPHWIIIDLRDSVNIAGIKYAPRQDSYGGRIGNYKIYVTNDPDNWGNAIIEGRWPDTDSVQTAVFPEPIRGQYLVVEAVNEVHTWNYVSIAEIDIIKDWRN